MSAKDGDNPRASGLPGEWKEHITGPIAPVGAFPPAREYTDDEYAAKTRAEDPGRAEREFGPETDAEREAKAVLEEEGRI